MHLIENKAFFNLLNRNNHIFTSYYIARHCSRLSAIYQQIIHSF